MGRNASSARRFGALAAASGSGQPAMTGKTGARPHVMAANLRSHARFAALYEKLDK